MDKKIDVSANQKNLRPNMLGNHGIFGQHSRLDFYH